MAATGPDNHVSVFLQDDVGAVVKVEDRDGIELGRGAARLGHRVWVDEVDLEHTPKHDQKWSVPSLCKRMCCLGEMTEVTL